MEVAPVGWVDMIEHVDEDVPLSASCMDVIEHSMLVISWDTKADGSFLVFKTAEPKSQIFAVVP